MIKIIQEKMRLRKIEERANKWVCKPIKYTVNPIKREHQAARISLIASLLYYLGGNHYQAKRNFNMWIYLFRRKK